MKGNKGSSVLEPKGRSSKPVQKQQWREYVTCDQRFARHRKTTNGAIEGGTKFKSDWNTGTDFFRKSHPSSFICCQPCSRKPRDPSMCQHVRWSPLTLSIASEVRDQRKSQSYTGPRRLSQSHLRRNGCDFEYGLTVTFLAQPLRQPTVLFDEKKNMLVWVRQRDAVVSRSRVESDILQGGMEVVGV